MRIVPLELLGVEQDEEEVNEDSERDHSAEPIFQGHFRSQPFAAFDVGERPCEETDDHHEKQKVHHTLLSSSSVFSALDTDIGGAPFMPA
jgi:hypothetical protein